MADLTDDEKLAAWTALQQFVDNCQEAVELHEEDPERNPLPEHYGAAVSALERLDAWVEERAMGRPAPGTP